ncbi:hypothetical protein [Mycobacterium sp. 1423905.2]|nr:hypothetical protein [Mycobacterium sp. 1423905.2]
MDNHFPYLTPYLTSHPSYALLLLVTTLIPAVMLAATINHGDSTF